MEMKPGTSGSGSCCINVYAHTSQLSQQLNIYAHTSQLSQQLAKWCVHKLETFMQHIYALYVLRFRYSVIQTVSPILRSRYSLIRAIYALRQAADELWPRLAHPSRPVPPCRRHATWTGLPEGRVRGAGEWEPAGRGGRLGCGPQSAGPTLKAAKPTSTEASRLHRRREERGRQGVDDINIMPFTTRLSAQIAEW